MDSVRLFRLTVIPLALGGCPNPSTSLSNSAASRTRAPREATRATGPRRSANSPVPAQPPRNQNPQPTKPTAQRPEHEPQEKPPGPQGLDDQQIPRSQRNHQEFKHHLLPHPSASSRLPEPVYGPTRDGGGRSRESQGRLEDQSRSKARCEDGV